MASAATPGIELWAKRYNGPGNGIDGANSVAVSPDGTKVFVTGSSVGSGYDYATIAYNASGAKLWARRYTYGDTDGASSLAVSPDGTKVFVTGASEGGDIFEWATLAYDASTGALLWATRYDIGQALSVAVSPDGTKVFVTGLAHSSGSATLAYDASTGARLWGKRDKGLRVDSLAVSPDGTKVIVTGGGGGYGTVAYDASTGSELWAKSYEKGDEAHALGVSPDGTKVFVTGEAYGSVSGWDYATVAYDSATGAWLWAKRYVKGKSASSLAVSPDGTRVFVTGSGDDSINGGDYATIAYDAPTGAKLWNRRYNGPSNLSDQAESLAVSPDGTKVFVTGASNSICGPMTQCPDYATLAYDASTGVKVWNKRFNGSSDDEASALAVSPDGTKVFVTGESSGSTSSLDYLTIAYAA